MEASLKLQIFENLGGLLEAKEQTGLVKTVNICNGIEYYVVSKYPTLMGGILVTSSSHKIYDFEKRKEAMIYEVKQSDVACIYYPEQKVVFRGGSSYSDFLRTEQTLLEGYTVVKSTEELLKDRAVEYLTNKFKEEIEALNSRYPENKVKSENDVDIKDILREIKHTGVFPYRTFTVKCYFLNNIENTDMAIRLYTDKEIFAEYCNKHYNKDEAQVLSVYHYTNEWNKQVDIIKEKLEKGELTELEKFLNIKNSLSSFPEARTLNVTLNDGTSVKVENNIRVFDNEIFRTVTGRNYIKIMDIAKITYGRNAIYTA